MYVLWIDLVPYRFQMLRVCFIAVHTVNQPNPSVNPHVIDAMFMSSFETSSSLKLGERRVSITTASPRLARPSYATRAQDP